MTRQQAEILRRTGHVCLADNGTGFMASVVNERRSAARKSDPNDEGDDPDDRLRTSAVESVQEREARFAEGRRVAAEIETRRANEDARRIASIDHMLNLAQCPEARDRLMFARNHGFELGVVWPAVLAMETEFRSQLSLVQEYRKASLGVKSSSNALRASRFLDDPDPDIRLYARIVSNQEPEEEAEPSSKKKKKKLGSREGQEQEFEEAEAGKTDKPGQTGADDPDADIDEYVRSRGWTK